jgi:hypothetical protein
MLIFRTGIAQAIRSISKFPLVSFCIVFSIVFAFAVGFSTSNFGTLVRYKIPCIPFFMAALFIIIYADPRNRLSNSRPEPKRLMKSFLMCPGTIFVNDFSPSTLSHLLSRTSESHSSTSMCSYHSLLLLQTNPSTPFSMITLFTPTALATAGMHSPIY